MPPCLRWLVALLALATVAVAKPPPDWLKPLLAEDIAALGRGKIAVRLLDSSDVRHLPDNRVRRVNRGAIKILTDTGRQRAACSYQFNADIEKILAARAWIVSADGKKADEFSIRAFTDTAMKIGNVFWPQQRVLGYRATTEIPVGSVFAWEFEVESQTGISDLGWIFPTDLSTLLSVLEVAPSPGGRLVWHSAHAQIPAPVPGPAPGSLRWVNRRYPSSVGGERPSGFLLASPTLSVRNIPADNSAIQTWPDMAGLAATIIEPRIPASAAVKAKAEALVADKTARWERIRALSEFVQKEISYLAVVVDPDYLAGYRPHAAGEVLQNRHGDCKDKATLLVSMLRALGDEGHVVLVFSGNPKAVEPNWPSARFNHAIAAIRADDAVPTGWPVVDAGPLGRLVLFDPTDSHTPLGILSAGDQGGYGLVASPRSTGLITLPIADPETNRIETNINASLRADGTLSAAIEEISRGSIAITLHAARESLRAERFTPVLEARLRDTVSFLENLQWQDNWDAPDARWTLTFDFTAKRYARRTGGSLMLISPQVVFSKVRLSPWKTKQDGVVWSGPNLQRKTVRLMLPAGATIEELPENWSFSVPTATCRLQYQRKGNVVLYDYEMTQRGGFLDQPAYEALRDFMQKAQDAERRPVLIRAPEADSAAPTK
ncbi:MAG: transglutaminase domain-containing protein [Opitutaceae bacterium]